MGFDGGWFHLDRFLQVGQSLIGNILQRQYAAPQQIRPVVIGQCGQFIGSDVATIDEELADAH